LPELRRSTSVPAAQRRKTSSRPTADIVHNAAGAVTASLWGNYYNDFWKPLCASGSYLVDVRNVSSGVGNYDYLSRRTPAIFHAVDAVTSTGKIKKPLITVAGTMDALLLIKNQARAYENAVDASRKGNNDARSAQYRLYEVQNGNHIESYVAPFPELVLIPHAQKASTCS
jgi:hypothetical protein